MAVGVAAVAVALLELVSVELVSELSPNELPALLELVSEELDAVEVAEDESVELVSDTVAVFELSLEDDTVALALLVVSADWLAL